jgi:hypothetical protein
MRKERDDHMRFMRRLLVPVLALVVLFSFSPANAGDGLLQKARKSSAELQRRAREVAQEPGIVLDGSKWTKYCLGTDICARLPGKP